MTPNGRGAGEEERPNASHRVVRIDGLKVAFLDPAPSGDVDDGVPQWGPSQGACVKLTVCPGAGQLLLSPPDGGPPLLDALLGTTSSLCKAGPSMVIITVAGTTLLIKCPNANDAQKIARGIEESAAPEDTKGGKAKPKSVFEEKIDSGSADLYFHYYGMLQHQQNMLHDYVRTGTYFAAITENRADFEGKVVMDVGAGTGILSFFAAQAGALKVYCVEASNMSMYTQTLIDNNPALGKVMEVVRGRVEDIDVPEDVDVLISEPMGTLLVNERMLESYIIARDRFLRPGGRMFPTIGRIHVAPFSDETLYWEVLNKAEFWRTSGNFYGVDVTSVYGEAVKGYFSQVVVDTFDPAQLMGAPVSEPINFGTCGEGDLVHLDMPLSFQAPPGRVTTVHGLATWFDVLFDGSQRQHWLTTAPGMPTTHWSQLRCVLHPPLEVAAGAQVTGKFLLVANRRQSFDITLTMTATPPGGGPPVTRTGQFDLKDPYYRMTVSPDFYQQATYPVGGGGTGQGGW